MHLARAEIRTLAHTRPAIEKMFQQQENMRLSPYNKLRKP
ncbi:hypothetical protein GJA_3700 [Janthinobacterium agaricidamnosum NBRC 102515 = DSM 9628]|uniref:Uncharacterized protein n=1 Tax=Janthinobacterium agaricidamnosum NBRC 102515 = DSM 9628 TaxID=1349767 RepID=W0V9M1_9BURK|nr:hypothetical protein GJA_3700 [Janthinobacterium agaricidamnosum NBRC 102515 = DSM 9628]